MNFQEEKQFAGHVDQLFQIRESELQKGKGAPAKLLDVKNRSGMDFTINLDRGMDIPYLSYHGENVGFVSPCGVVAPQYFDDRGLGFLKGFTAGFLTTCGLKYAGGPCEYEGQHYGLHGNISNTPAERYSYELVEEGGNAYAEIRGYMRDAVLFGDKLSLRRTVRCHYREKKFTLSDVVTNEGYQRVRHMILYHMNIGYPVLSPDSLIHIPSAEVRPRNDHAASAVERWNKAEQPDAAYEEMCYYHRLQPDASKKATVAIYNPAISTGVAIEIDTATLDHFVQWKMMGKGDYVMGLEPCNTTIDGIADALENGSLKYLEPGEQVKYHLSVRILDSMEAFEGVK